MILSAKRALLAIDYTKKVMEAIGTSLIAQTMMLYAQGWAAARCFVLLSFFFVLFFIFEFVHSLHFSERSVARVKKYQRKKEHKLTKT